ncbi:MAG TPA: hypothetical protein PKM72_13585 [Nitrospirales bacterium]|nr:hypothetical protein [Nitrospirales bacterium]
MRLETTVRWFVRMALYQEIIPPSTPDDGVFRIFQELKEGFGSPLLSVHGGKWYS